jgi:hypothetical protein
MGWYYSRFTPMNIPLLSSNPQHAPLREAMAVAFSRVYDSYQYVNRVKRAGVCRFQSGRACVSVAGLDAWCSPCGCWALAPAMKINRALNTIAAWLKPSTRVGIRARYFMEPTRDNLDGPHYGTLPPRTRAIMRGACTLRTGLP